MAKKNKIGKKRKIGKKDDADALWISPRFSLKGVDGERAWENRPGGPPHSSRYLELADISLGLKKPTPKKTKRPATHDTTKRKPYSR